jgi:hypothetical protein
MKRHPSSDFKVGSTVECIRLNQVVWRSKIIEMYTDSMLLENGTQWYHSDLNGGGKAGKPVYDPESINYIRVVTSREELCNFELSRIMSNLDLNRATSDQIESLLITCRSINANLVKLNLRAVIQDTAKPNNILICSQYKGKFGWDLPGTSEPFSGLSLVEAHLEYLRSISLYLTPKNIPEDKTKHKLVTHYDKDSASMTFWHYQVLSYDAEEFNRDKKDETTQYRWTGYQMLEYKMLDGYNFINPVEKDIRSGILEELLKE